MPRPRKPDSASEAVEAISMSQTTAAIVLYFDEYVHILSTGDGSIRTVEGPCRLTLQSHERLLAGEKRKQVTVSRDQYAVVLNPFDPVTGKFLMGGRRVIEGPCMFSLHHHEVLEQGCVHNVYVLSEGQALVVKALVDHNGVPAGHLKRVVGPCRFIPTKYEHVEKELEAICLSEGEGIYVRDIEKSETRLVKGPQVFMLGVNEELWCKPWAETESKALGLDGVPSHVAHVVNLRNNEVMCILDREYNRETVVRGPQSYIFKPQEGVKVLSLSAGKPKRANQILAAILKLGPDFMSDKFQVRTKDNAVLSLAVTYRWQFLVTEQNIERVFSMNDFVGYACQSLCSGIREEAARHNFEDFHHGTVALLRKSIFRSRVVDGVIGSVEGFFVPEILLYISEIDIKDIQPVKEDISALLSQSIKQNIMTVCRKLEQAATLAAEKEYVLGEGELQDLKQDLIDIENTNLALDTVEKAKIEGQAAIEKAKAEKEADEIVAKARMGLERERIEKIIQLLGSDKEGRFLAMQRILSMNKVPQTWILPTKSSYEKLVEAPPKQAEEE